MIDWQKIELLIIDMDNTLADTFHTLSVPQWGKVEKALREKGLDRYADLLEKNFGKKGFKTTLEESGMSKEDIAYAIGVYDDVDVTPLRLFDDVDAILDLDMRKVLLSRGERELQERKIRHLGLEERFDDIVIIDTFYSKVGAIEELLETHDLEPEEALVIGDRVEEEIAAGKMLGIPTVLVRRPDRPVHEAEYEPDMVVDDLHEIAEFLQ